MAERRLVWGYGWTLIIVWLIACGPKSETAEPPLPIVAQPSEVPSAAAEQSRNSDTETSHPPTSGSIDGRPAVEQPDRLAAVAGASCSADESGRVELGKVEGRRPPDLALRARNGLLQLAYRRSGDTVHYIREENGGRVERDVTVPDDFFPIGIVQVGDHTVLLTTGLCPNLPRSRWVKCLHFTVLDAGGQQVAQPSFDRIDEWSAGIFQEVVGGFFHVHVGMYQPTRITRYQVGAQGVSRTSQINTETDSHQGSGRVAFDGERWALVVDETGELFCSDRGSSKVPLPAGFAQGRVLSDVAWDEANLMLTLRGDRDCRYATIDCQSGALHSAVQRSSAPGDLPEPLLFRVHPRCLLEGSTLKLELRDACDRVVKEQLIDDTGLRDQNRLRQRSVIDGTRVYVAYTAREGQTWSIRLSRLTCSLP